MRYKPLLTAHKVHTPKVLTLNPSGLGEYLTLTINDDTVLSPIF